MNELKVFENPEFGTVRTVVIDNEPWFVGKDVADILGYQNGRLLYLHPDRYCCNSVVHKAVITATTRNNTERRSKPMRITVTEAAKMLGMSPQAVRIGIQRGKLPIGTCWEGSGGRYYYYHITEERVKRYMEGKDL